MRLWVLVSSIVMAALLAAEAARAEQPQYDQVEFSVHAEIELQNDLSEVVLAAEAEHPDPAELANEINRTMSWALSRTRGVAGVDVQTGDYQTYPVYEKDRLLRWRATQILLLRSPRFEDLNKMVGGLQQRLQVKSMRFTVSPARQRASEAQLTDQLMEAFKERAARIQRGLSAKGYRIVRLTLDAAAPPPHFPVMARTAMMEKSGAEPVAAEAGSSRLQLDLRAVIELQF